jgi:hypothetical protein
MKYFTDKRRPRKIEKDMKQRCEKAKVLIKSRLCALK